MKVEEIIQILVNEVKMLILDMERVGGVNIDEILQETYNQLNLNFNAVFDIGDRYNTKMQVMNKVIFNHQVGK